MEGSQEGTQTWQMNPTVLQMYDNLTEGVQENTRAVI